MKANTRTNAVAGLSAAAFFLAVSGEAQALDTGAAQALARKSNCFKCHALDKKKEAVSWKEVAAKYKGKPDAEAKLTKHITTGPKVKFDDGSEEDHPIVKTKDQGDIKNLIEWILSM